MKRLLLSCFILHFSLFFFHSSFFALYSQSRGIGCYPGDPEAYFGPVPTTTSTTMCNLALHRAAWASSTADYNLTAHLVTDGICDEHQVSPLIVSTPEGVLSRREAEWAIDGGPYSNHILMGGQTWIVYQWAADVPFTAHALKLDARVAYHEEQATQGYRIACQMSGDGQTWTTVGELAGDGLPGTAMRYKLHSDPNKQTAQDYLPARLLQEEQIVMDDGRCAKDDGAKYFRLLLEMPGAAYWQLNDIHFFDDGGREVWMQPSQAFCSAWMSKGGGAQWLKVDLGAPATIDHITPHWAQEPKRWHTEVSDDGRYVTIVMEEPNASGFYALRELEVWGTGGVTFAPHEIAGSKGNRLELSGGHWQLQRASEVEAQGEEIATEGYDSSSWIWATVPGTVLSSYINIGAVPNPNYADWVDQISESFFRSNFWYRDVFEVSAELLNEGTLQRLHFDGINWKANVFLNGHRLGRVEGAFRRGEFDVSGLLREGTNVLAVEIICNEHFGVVKEKDENTTQFNGGILGADNPTFHATIGWDWITTVRGRNAGIWNEVYVTSGAALTLSDPYVRTEVKGTQVTVTPSVFVCNHGNQSFHGTISGWIGDVRFEQPLTLPAHHEEEIAFAPSDFPQLTRSDFHLWWPNGYGEAYRYEAGFCVEGEGLKDSRLDYKVGLREMRYEHLNDSVLIYVNGRRFVPMGGNWGFDEHNLCYRSREYLTAVGYHRDMHCTMIRDWVGMIGDDAFYEACDSLGVMIWQDFWLANPADGPDPYHEALFLNNAEDYVRRIRQHASIGIFCGRNEGYPPASLDRQLRRYVSELTPGLAYISSSADDGVTGHGPYCAQPAKVYFEKQSGKLHTERGMPAVMNIESLSRTFTTEALWPQSKQWGQHDYTLLGAQRAQEFNGLVDKAFGASTSAAQFARRAQLINYEGYRAMFESTSRARAGLLIWMSHPCWPSMVWQTYDYYFEPTAAYFGVKKACEPLHIQLNALTDSIEVVNLFAGDKTGLTAAATLYDLNGKRLWQKKVKVDSRDDSTVGVIRNLQYSNYKSQCVLLRLQLSDKKEVISENDYILRNEEGTKAPLGTWPSGADVEQKTVVTGTSAVVTLRNRGRAIAPFVRLNLKGSDGEQILPVIYSDNYFNLLPGERHTVTITWKAEDARGQQPVVEVETLEGQMFRGFK